MSFHQRFRGLPAELRDLIYTHALCPPEGITIRTENPFADEPNFTCHPPLTTGLLRANSETYSACLPILYGGNLLILNMNCASVLSFLKALPSESAAMIKRIGLGQPALDATNLSRIKREELSTFLIETLNLDSVSVCVPDVWVTGEEEQGGSMYAGFFWGVNQQLILAFKEGKFKELRFWHTSPKDWDGAIYLLPYVRVFLERILPENLQVDLRKKTRSFGIFRNETSGDDTSGGNVPKELYEEVHSVWESSGVVLKWEKGTYRDGNMVVVVSRK